MRQLRRLFPRHKLSQAVTGRRGRRPLRSGRTFPRRGDSRIARRHARTSDKRARPWAGRRPLRCGRTFPRKFRIPNSAFRIPNSAFISPPAQRTDTRARPWAGRPPLRSGRSPPRIPIRRAPRDTIIIHYSSFIIHLPPCDSCDSCDGFSPVASCHGPSRAPAPTERTDVSPQIPNSEFRIPNSSPPCDSCDSCDGFSPVASCHKLSRAVAPGRICDETVNGFSENARKMIETKKTLWYNK